MAITNQRLRVVLVIFGSQLLFISFHAQANLRVDDFNVGITPPEEARVWEARLKGGWRARRGYGAPNLPSPWDITGGRIENPANVAPSGSSSQYTESESPVWQWWTNPAPGVPDVAAHAWHAITMWGLATPSQCTSELPGASSPASKSGSMIEAVRTNLRAYRDTTTCNLPKGANPSTITASISDALTETGTFKWSFALASLVIPCIKTVGNMETFFIAFAADDTGGGTTWIDNLNVVIDPVTVDRFR